jgi:hypothetical protein
LVDLRNEFIFVVVVGWKKKMMGNCIIAHDA